MAPSSALSAGTTRSAPRLVAGVRPLRRGAGQVQFGVGPGAGVVLTGLTEAETGWLVSLRSGPATTRSASPRAWGVPAPRAQQLTEVLSTHGLLEERPSRSLPGSGVATVAVLGADLLPRLPALLRAGLDRRVSTTVDGDDTADLVVLVSVDAVPPHEGQGWAASGVPHLPVVVSGRGAVVGPLVAEPSAPCLHCLDLTRSDQDPAWPTLLSQLQRADGDTTRPAVDPALALTVSGLVCVLVRARLRGIPVPPGVTWELALPSPSVTARRWSVHPRCPARHDGR